MNDSQDQPVDNSRVEMEEQVGVEQQDQQQQENEMNDSLKQEDEQQQQPTRRTSALQDNIAKKGKNAYYYAHGNKPDGPDWDGRAEPRLLSKSSDGEDNNMSEGNKKALLRSVASFDFKKSNITSYSFLDDGPVVKLYLTGFDDIGTLCTNDDIILDYTERSFCFTITNYYTPSSLSSEPQILCFTRLCGPISDVSFKLKKNKIIITLTKHEKELKDWHTINDNGNSVNS